MSGQMMKKIEDALRATKHWTEFLPILAARTPILRAFNIPEKMECDLSFSNGLSHCNTKLINYFIEVQPLCKLTFFNIFHTNTILIHVFILLLVARVAAIIKFYAQEADFKMNSYIITLLVVFYFQYEKLLPPVYMLQKELEPQMIGRKFKALLRVRLKFLRPLPMRPRKNVLMENFVLGFFEILIAKEDRFRKEQKKLVSRP